MVSGLGLFGLGALFLSNDVNDEPSIRKLNNLKILSNNFKGISGIGGEPGAQVVLILDDAKKYTTIVGVDGKWTLSDNNSKNYIADGVSGKIYQIALDGFSETISTGVAYTINPSSPDVLINNNNEISGTSDSKGGKIIIIGSNGKEFSTTVDLDGNWRFDQKQKVLNDQGEKIEENICEDKKACLVRVIDIYQNESDSINSEINNNVLISNISFQDFNDDNVIAGKEKKFILKGSFNINGNFIKDNVKVTIDYSIDNEKVSQDHFIKNEYIVDGVASWEFTFDNNKFFSSLNEKEPKKIFLRDLTFTVDAENNNGILFKKTKVFQVKIDPELEKTPEFIDKYNVIINKPDLVNNEGKITKKEDFNLTGKFLNSKEGNDDVFKEKPGEVIDKILLKLDDEEYTYSSASDSNQLNYNPKTGEWSLNINKNDKALLNGYHTIQVLATIKKNDLENTKTFSNDFKYEVSAPESRSSKLNFKHLFLDVEEEYLKDSETNSFIENNFSSYNHQDNILDMINNNLIYH